MAEPIFGILGESTATVGATITVYTVPAGRAAKVWFMWYLERSGGTGAEMTVMIGTPGDETVPFHYGGLGANIDVMTGTRPQTGPDPANSGQLGHAGVQNVAALFDLDNLDYSAPLTIGVPIGPYYLSAGDTVKFDMSAVELDNLFTCMGVEFDDGV